ncbi:hypothetical protein AAVH_36748, partial [Aphelenchoides avenae]
HHWTIQVQHENEARSPRRISGRSLSVFGERGYVGRACPVHNSVGSMSLAGIVHSTLVLECVDKRRPPYADLYQP